VLIELAPGVSVERVTDATGAPFTVADDLAVSNGPSTGSGSI